VVGTKREEEEVRGGLSRRERLRDSISGGRSLGPLERNGFCRSSLFYFPQLRLRLRPRGAAGRVCLCRLLLLWWWG
jgi:hypothetical protein